MKHILVKLISLITLLSSCSERIITIDEFPYVIYTIQNKFETTVEIKVYMYDDSPVQSIYLSPNQEYSYNFDFHYISDKEIYFRLARKLEIIISEETIISLIGEDRLPNSISRFLERNGPYKVGKVYYEVLTIDQTFVDLFVSENS